MEDRVVLEELLQQSRAYSAKGKVADYIPELAKRAPNSLGITVHRIDREPVSAGDCGTSFTLQSISKVFSLILALMDQGEERIFNKVGMEPTGDNFNSMVKLELVNPGKPFNPMINAGAIAISSMIAGKTPDERFARLLAFIRTMAGDDTIAVNSNVYESEAATADRNRSLAYFLKHNQVLEGSVEDHLEVYFKHCSIEVTCRHIARMAMILANNGVDPESGQKLIPRRYVQIAKVFMITCGMYNASGEFAIQVGIPAKSGVSGGILAVVPGQMGIGVIGPALSEKGNSVAGVQLLQSLSARWDLSIF
ncbi:glutaminase A [Xylanibacillus composti]|uniref:Glutaminase n=1 Tax=Xylanibacillus composti TaxID=1572762 RepID=A0A8J4GXX7_9BACL|nr:glutaminase A [Xylanibacillus composti]GIQ67217.1 glutaminase [Xylanibacillus composti]